MVYWLGTDGQARDMLSAIFYGMRISLFVGAVSVVVALAIGVMVGWSRPMPAARSTRC